MLRATSPGIDFGNHVHEKAIRMRQNISFITLGVADLARSRAFYAALGWRESSGSQPEIAFFNAGDGGLRACSSARHWPRMPMSHRPAAAFPALRWPTMSTRQRRVDRLLAEAVAVGARLVRPADKVFWGGYRGYFADPDGFLWEVCWNPFFPLDEQGHVCLPA